MNYKEAMAQIITDEHIKAKLEEEKRTNEEFKKVKEFIDGLIETMIAQKETKINIST